MWWQGGLRLFCCFFSYFIGFTCTSRRLRGDNLREKISAFKNKVSYLEHEVLVKPPKKASGSFGHAWRF